MKIIEKYDYKEVDVYRIDERRPMTTREISVMVDFEKGEITGDCIAYGEWYDLDIEECKEILKAIPKKERLRDYEYLL